MCAFKRKTQLNRQKKNRGKEKKKAKVYIEGRPLDFAGVMGRPYESVSEYYF